MEKTPYLKKELKTNVPKLLTIKKRGKSYPEKKFGTDELTGKNEFHYVFRDESGSEFQHYAKEREEESLSLFSPGESVQVVLQEMLKDTKRIGFLVWTAVDGVEARAAVETPLQGNTASVRNEQKATQRKKEEDDKWERIDLSKIIFGYMNTMLAQGKTPKESVEAAVEAYRYQTAAVEKLLKDKPSHSQLS